MPAPPASEPAPAQPETTKAPSAPPPPAASTPAPSTACGARATTEHRGHQRSVVARAEAGGREPAPEPRLRPSRASRRRIAEQSQRRRHAEASTGNASRDACPHNPQRPRPSRRKWREHHRRPRPSKDPALARFTREVQRAGTRVLDKRRYPALASMGKNWKGKTQIEVQFAPGGYISQDRSGRELRARAARREGAGARQKHHVPARAEGTVRTRVQRALSDRVPFRQGLTALRLRAGHWQACSTRHSSLLTSFEVPRWLLSHARTFSPAARPRTHRSPSRAGCARGAIRRPASRSCTSPTARASIRCRWWRRTRSPTTPTRCCT